MPRAQGASVNLRLKATRFWYGTELFECAPSSCGCPTAQHGLLSKVTFEFAK